MKNTILGIIAIAAILGIIGLAGNIECHYSLNGRVVSRNSDLITIEDDNGNLWDIVGDDLNIGDRVKLKMFDNHTTKIYDDEVVAVRVRG